MKTTIMGLYYWGVSCKKCLNLPQPGGGALGDLREMLGLLTGTAAPLETMNSLLFRKLVSDPR